MLRLVNWSRALISLRDNQMAAKVHTPETEGYKYADDEVSVFLAGSIEMDTAENWQIKAIELLDGFTIFNPRRVNWDSSWVQSKDNPEFSRQVNWELDHLDLADFVILYFDPNTKSPVSLLELGLLAGEKGIYYPSSKLHVVCPEGFYRKGNVDIVCERFCIAQHETLEEAVTAIRNYSKRHFHFSP